MYKLSLLYRLGCPFKSLIMGESKEPIDPKLK
jgi:hypothetical protein